jgi:hypothetical protein
MLRQLAHGSFGCTLPRSKITPGAPPNSQFPGSLCGEWRYAVADTHIPSTIASTDVVDKGRLRQNNFSKPPIGQPGQKQAS